MASKKRSPGTQHERRQSNLNQHVDNIIGFVFDFTNTTDENQYLDNHQNFDTFILRLASLYAKISFNPFESLTSSSNFTYIQTCFESCKIGFAQKDLNSKTKILGNALNALYYITLQPALHLINLFSTMMNAVCYILIDRNLDIANASIKSVLILSKLVLSIVIALYHILIIVDIALSETKLVKSQIQPFEAQKTESASSSNQEKGTYNESLSLIHGIGNFDESMIDLREKTREYPVNKHGSFPLIVNSTSCEKNCETPHGPSKQT